MTKNKQTFSITGTAEILVPDKLGRSSYLLTLLIIILMLLVIGAVYTKLPSMIPLYFSLTWGEVRLAPKIMFISIPALTLVFGIVNLGLGRLSTKLSPLLPRVLAVATATVAVMMLLSVIGIIQSLVL